MTVDRARLHYGFLNSSMINFAYWHFGMNRMSKVVDIDVAVASTDYWLYTNMASRASPAGGTFPDCSRCA